MVVLVGLLAAPSVAASLDELAPPVGPQWSLAPVDGEDAPGFGEAPADESIEPWALLPEDALGNDIPWQLFPSRPTNSAVHTFVAPPDLNLTAEEVEPAAQPIVEEPAPALETPETPTPETPEEQQSFEWVPVVRESEAPSWDIPASPAPSPLQPHTVLPLEPVNPDVPLTTLFVLSGLAVVLAASRGALAKGLKRIFTMPWWSLFSHVGRGEAVAHRHSLQERIQGLVGSHPGITLMELGHLTGQRRGALRYHLRHMELLGLVKSAPFGRARHYFSAGRQLAAPMVVLAVLSKPRNRSALAVVRENPGWIQKQVGRAVGLGPSQIHNCLAQLKKVGLVWSSREGRTVKYYPTPLLRTLGAIGSSQAPASGSS